MNYLIIFLLTIYALLTIKWFRGFLRERRHWHYEGIIFWQELTLVFCWPLLYVIGALLWIWVLLTCIVEWYYGDDF